MISFPLTVFRNKRLLASLIKNDFKQKYLGSFIGMAWAFIHPTVTILVLWVVFQAGFKTQPVGDVPFILWLVTGMFPWFFFSEAVLNGTHSILANSFLVKKIVFQVDLLPLIPLISALVIHIFFIFFTFLMYASFGIFPTIYWIQIPYYLFAMTALLLGLSWITSSIVVFFRDVGQIVSVIVQLGFWATPIFWSTQTVPPRFHWIININPIAYLIEGYRDCLINQKWFWDAPYLTLYFWSITIVILVVGNITFKRLKPHFTDVL